MGAKLLQQTLDEADSITNSPQHSQPLCRERLALHLLNHEIRRCVDP